jgi:hypothetical protein
MHRSGTSALTGVLGRVGVELGPHLGSPLPDNPTGFFEHTGIVGVHEELLAALGTAWDDPRSLPPGWHREPGIAQFREQLAAIIVRDFSASRVWGVKDPRLCRTLPLWLDVLAELNVDAKAVLVGREPGAVSASLRKRNAIDIEQGTMLWLSYVLSAELHSRGLARTVVLYDDLLADWKAEIDRLYSALGLELDATSTGVHADVAAFLQSELRHHANVVGPALRAPQNACAQPVYDALVAWRRDGAVSPDAFAAAADELVRAERAAEPVARYVRFKARTDFDAGLKAELDATVEARRRLTLQLVAQTQGRTEDRRIAAEAAAREADARAKLDACDRATAATEARLGAEIAAAREAVERARAEADSAARQHAKTVADTHAELRLCQLQAAATENLLRDMQHSYSWRLTRPIRIGLTALRERIRRGKRGLASRSASPPS